MLTAGSQYRELLRTAFTSAYRKTLVGSMNQSLHDRISQINDCPVEQVNDRLIDRLTD